MPMWLGWWLALNVATMLVYGYDKAIAGGPRRRIPERTLLALALLGGSPGALLAMGLFRHKTVKVPFRRYAILWTVLNPFWVLLWWTLSRT